MDPGDPTAASATIRRCLRITTWAWKTACRTADGTITRTIYNAEAEVTSVWIGAGGWSETPDDAPEEGQDYWTTAHPDNMVEVAAFVYDNGGVGDGNVTESVSFQYAAAAADWHATAPTADVTLVGYDWRDRPIAEKDGAMATVSHNATSGLWDVTLTPGDEGTGDDTTARPMTVDVLDNLGEPTAEYVFAANGKSLADVTDYVAAHPDDPNYDNLLRATRPTRSTLKAAFMRPTFTASSKRAKTRGRSTKRPAPRRARCRSARGGWSIM